MRASERVLLRRSAQRASSAAQPIFSGRPPLPTGGLFLNNEFTYNDYSGVDVDTAGGGKATLCSDGDADIIVRNTFKHNGAGVALDPGAASFIALNRFEETMAIQVSWRGGCAQQRQCVTEAHADIIKYIPPPVLSRTTERTCKFTRVRCRALG